tara:strand:- start:718 stop:1614 length:897 start_codon:yes stop_codon:yes gene_type:complete
MATRNFHNSNKKTKYGEHDVKFWIGIVAGYASQEKQLESGYGWMYKVRIDGDHSNDKKKVKDEQLSYAYCILPTTAGSGAAFKLRSARISQGDTVFGVRGGGVGAPAFIIGVFPRTRETVFATTTEIENGTRSGGLTGFYGSLVKNKTLTGEFNDQIGPGTPGVTPVNPKTYNKSNKEDTSESLDEIGYDRNQDGIIDDAEKKLTPVRTAEDRKWDVGEPITSQQLQYITSSYPITRKEATEYQTEVVEAINQAVTQNLVTEEVAQSMITEVKRNNYNGALNIGFPPPTPFSEQPIVP